MLKVWNLSLVVGRVRAGDVRHVPHARLHPVVRPRVREERGRADVPGVPDAGAGRGFGLIAWRSWRLGSEGRFDAVLSREAAFLGNNLVLLAITLVVLIGTIYPLFVEATTNQQVTVGGPVLRPDHRAGVPAAAVPGGRRAAAAVAAGERRAAPRGGWRCRRSVGAAVMVVAGGGRRAERGGAARYGLAAFVMASNVEEIVRGVRAFGRATRPRGARVGGAGRPRATGARSAATSRTSGWPIPAIAIAVSSTFAPADGGHAVAGAGHVVRRLHAPVPGRARRPAAAAHGADRRRRGHSRRPDAGAVNPSLNLYPAATEPIGTPSIQYGVLKDLYSSVSRSKATAGRRRSGSS